MISQYIANIQEISAGQRKNALTTRFYHDFTCLIYAIDFFMESDTMKKKAKESIKNFVEDRVLYHKEYFKNCVVLKNAYEFFKKVVDRYVKNE